MTVKFKNFKKNNDAISKLTIMLFLFIIMALVMGALAVFMKYSRGMQIEDLLSAERLKRFFLGQKPVISAEEAARIKSFVTAKEDAGGLEISNTSINGDENNKTAPAVKKIKGDEIILRNNDIFTGEIISDKIAIKTEHGVINFKFGDIIAAYSVYEAEKPYDKIISKNGDKVSGEILDEFITLKTAAGDIIKISKSKIKIINKNIGSPK